MDVELWRALDVGDACIKDLERFAALVRKWNPAINLVAKSTLDDVWSRHIEDSARICLTAPATEVWADLGSGGGFPGLVAAIVFRQQGRKTRFVLVESDQRKAAFLREASRVLALGVDVVPERAEALAPLGAGIVSARALSPLAELCALVERHLLPDGVALLPKGENWRAEVDLARTKWRFDLVVADEPVHKGAILQLRSLARA